MTLGDYPWCKWSHERVTGWPIRGLTERIKEKIAFNDVKMGEAPTQVGGSIKDRPLLVTAGQYVLVALGTGPTVVAAQDDAYAVTDKINWPCHTNMRTDIGNRLEDGLKKLQAHGFAEGMRYE